MSENGLNEQLKQLLSPADDGRGFTEAVLLEASGALARRRSQPEAASPWTWLERWARPWVLGALAALALLAVLPALQPEPRGTAAADEPVELLLASPQPEVTLTVSYGR
jgi:hypothetical protein